MKILLVLLLGLAIFGSIDCDCFKYIKKYFLCKYFTPLMIQDPNDKIYYQDSSLTYDLVPDAFVKSRKIENYTMDEAMGFYKTIFTEMNGKSAAAKCFNTNFRDYDGSYSRLFTNKGYYDGAKDIIVNFKNSIKAHLKNRNDSDISDLWTDWNSSDTPTLVDFCLKNEITSENYKFYNSPALDCFMETYAYYELYWSCVYDLFVNNKSATVNPSPNTLKIAQCSILQVRNCTEEKKIYYGLTDWTNYFSKKLKVPSGKTKMADFFKKISDDGEKLLPKISWKMKTAYAFFAYRPEIRKLDGSFLKFQLNSCNFYETILSTDTLLLEGFWQLFDSECYLSKANLTLYSSPKNKIAFKTYDVINPNFKSKAYTKVNKKNVLFEIISKESDYNYIELYVLNSNAYIRLYYYYVDIYIPKEQLNNSTDGIFVDGFDHSTIISRRRRDASSSDNDECENCLGLRMFKPSTPSSPTRSADLKQCMKKCQ